MQRLLFGVALLTCACGGSTTDLPDSGKDAGGDVVKEGGTPKPPPPDSGTPTTTTATFALQTIYLGDSDRTGTLSATAWKAFGLDVDGLSTVKADTNVCTLQQNAPKQNQADGDNGIDNAWGATILPIFQAAATQPNPSATETGFIDQGTWTAQLQITGLSDDPKQTAPGLIAQIFTSGPYDNGTPAFDATTDWPVLSTSVVDGVNISSGAKAVFKDAFITSGTFITQTAPDPLVLSLNFNGVQIDLHIHASTITFDHSAPTKLTNGTIAGVLDTQEFVATLKAAAGQISPTLCGAAFNGIAQQLEQASDIMNDGTNGPGPTCNGISVGIGFDAQLVANPTKVVPPPPPPPDPCQ